MISLENEILVGPGTRYELVNNNFELSASSLKMVNYTAQYRLVVNSQFGPTSGEGWYNAGVTASVSAPTRVPVGGLLGFLGVANALAYWAGPDDRVVSNPIVMRAPTNVTAVYVLSFPVETFAVGLVALVTILVSLVIIARKWMS